MKNDEISKETVPENIVSSEEAEEGVASAAVFVAAEPTTEPEPVKADVEAKEASEGAVPVEAAEDDGDDDEDEVDVIVPENEFAQDDPLDQAYDLDRGAPIETAPMHAQLPWRSAIKNAKEFFNSELLYRFDVLEPEEHKNLEGTYRLELKGYQGGIWTMRVGKDLEVVNRREDADIVITMLQKDFLQLVNGRLNPQLAILGQKMRIQGDVRKAIMFQSLLAPVNE